MPRRPQAVASNSADEAGAGRRIRRRPSRPWRVALKKKPPDGEGGVGGEVHAVHFEAVEAGVEIDVGPAEAEADAEDRAAALIVEAGLDALEILLVAGVEDGGAAAAGEASGVASRSILPARSWTQPPKRPSPARLPTLAPAPGPSPSRAASSCAVIASALWYQKLITISPVMTVSNTGWSGRPTSRKLLFGASNSRLSLTNGLRGRGAGQREGGRRWSPRSRRRPGCRPGRRPACRAG